MAGGDAVPGMVAERAVRLPWLAPGAEALAALAVADDPLNDPAVLADPLAIALVMRFAESDARFRLTLPPHSRARLLRFIARRLGESPIGIAPIDITESLNRRARRFAIGAQQSVDRIGSPETLQAAYNCGLLTLLGEYAIRSLGAPDLHIDCHDLTRRLACRWQFPPWCIAALSYYRLPVEAAKRLGADAQLIAALQSHSENVQCSQLPTPWRNPYETPLLHELVLTAAEVHRKRRDHLLESLESENGRLQTALTEQHATEEERVRTRKLLAIAEFAAGAGHEINTPLAIISGQAQYLLGREEEPEVAKALQTIVQQTRRVHDILTELMQFARPAPPVAQVLDLSLIVREAVSGFHDMSIDRDVRIETILPESFLAFADPRQVRTALQCLVRNAAEAVPSGGWVRITGIAPTHGSLEVIVEDSGPGPDHEAVPYLFDPFYSGRPAGRGRGLGLPTAWRLAREQGGDVRFEPVADCPARFVLALPKAEAFPGSERISA